MPPKLQKEIARKKPEIQAYFSQPSLSAGLSAHMQKAQSLLHELLPPQFYQLPDQKIEAWFQENLPLISWDPPKTLPDALTMRFLCAPTQEIGAEKIIIEVVRKWLIPEKEIHILSNQNFYFYMKEASSRLFFIAELTILVENDRDLSIIRDHLPLLSSELSLSLASTKYLEQILDTKGLTLDQKSSQVQFYLRKLTERAPHQFDMEVFREMSTFYALSIPDFRKFRMPKHLTRVIVSHYLMRKKILHQLSVSPEKRHLEFRFLRSKLHFPFGTKSVLGLSIAVVLADRYETFEDSHIINAVQKFIPSIQIVKGSSYSYRPNQDPIKYIYLELEKKDGSSCTQQEIRLLNRELKDQLKKRIEKLIPSVFMIRNEEEVMRSILLLSQELRYLSDIPQVMINFDKQEGEELFFTVILVRVLKKHDLPLEKLFTQHLIPFRFLPDRVQNVGYVRKKNPKEANVFHLCIPKERAILRTNSSVNFYVARQKIISILNEALGDIRDYNGGMILKQGELFTQFQEIFSGIAVKDQELLENFFFAMNPIEAQATVPIDALKTLFQICLEATVANFDKRDSHFKKIIRKKDVCFAVLRVKGNGLEKILSKEISQLENFSKSLIRTKVMYQGTTLQGMIYFSSSESARRAFKAVIDTSLNSWKTQVRNQQELRLSFVDLPLSLDPRLGGDEYSVNILKMLFEGLTRVGKDSKPALALAKSVEISPDQKRYTFTLRPSKWSNGDPVVAYNFEYAWKKVLSPSLYTPFAYFFYPIKNAKAVKEGSMDIDSVGIKVIDEMTLVVELENPTPEFLEYIAHPLYCPINHKVEQLHPNWAQSGGEDYICNGPMRLAGRKSNGGYLFTKNPHFWDVQNVKLDRITINKNNSETAIGMYNNDEIDWIGHPMRNWETYFATNDPIYTTQALGTHWCVFNTQRYPFDLLKMRLAFTYAIDREHLIKTLPFSPEAAVSLLPKIHTGIKDPKIAKGNRQLAKQLFEEALKEAGLTRESFPVLSMYHPSGQGRQKAAKGIASMWEEVLGITCRVEDYPFHVLFPKMIKGDYQLAMMTWKSWINDPLYTLNAFQYRKNRVNFSKWEHSNYQMLLEAAQREIIPEKRTRYFAQAEEILIHECPVIPIHYEVYRYSHKKELKGAFASHSGNVEFRWASIAPR